MGRNFSRDEILIHLIGVKPICFLFNWDDPNEHSVHTYPKCFNKAVDLPAILSGTGQKSVPQQFDE